MRWLGGEVDDNKEVERTQGESMLAIDGEPIVEVVKRESAHLEK